METTANTPEQVGPYMDSKTAAAYLTISKRHFARLKARGLIPCKRLSTACIRYRKSDLDALMSK